MEIRFSDNRSTANDDRQRLTFHNQHEPTP